MKNWKVNSWRKYPVKHIPTYGDEKELNSVLNKLKTFPPLVFAGETRHLKDQLAKVVDNLNIPVLCYGLRVDFQGELFPGSLVLLSIADEMREIKTICHCGKKATMVARLNEEGKVITKGQQIQIGGNESYISLCRLHWCEEIENANINDYQS